MHGAGVDHEGNFFFFFFFKKKFGKRQIHCSTVVKEALALLWALQHFEVDVGSTFTPVFTDHNPLVFLSHVHNHNNRLMRWSLILQEFNIETHHIKAGNNMVADALSRVGA